MNEFETTSRVKHQRRPRYSGTHPKHFNEKYKEHNLAAHPEIKEHLRAKGKTPAGTHVPVLVEEVMACLNPKPGEIVADCTVGYGGHASEFLKRIGPTGKLIAIDADNTELERTRNRLSKDNAPVSFHHSNFAGLAKVLKKEGLAGCDIIFADLGVSSMQIDNPQRGMSYKHEGPIDMRMDSRLKQTGADLLNTLSEEELSKAFLELADEPDHKKIAEFIVNQRKVTPITQTDQLIRIIFSVKGLTEKLWKKQNRAGFGKLHPAARTFQALRILVNDELGSLKEIIENRPILPAAGRANRHNKFSQRRGPACKAVVSRQRSQRAYTRRPHRTRLCREQKKLCRTPAVRRPNSAGR